MKKIPCLFVRTFAPRGRGSIATITPAIMPGLENVLTRGTATVKYDGTACMVRDDRLFKRYDVKNGKPVPFGAIPCENAPDATTGHWPHWVEVDTEPESKWHRAAWDRAGAKLPNGTYELVGPHFQGNPHGFEEDSFVIHGAHELEDVPRTFEGLREYLKTFEHEGIVFWLEGEPRCKIRRADFGFAWPISQVAEESA